MYNRFEVRTDKLGYTIQVDTTGAVRLLYDDEGEEVTVAFVDVPNDYVEGQANIHVDRTKVDDTQDFVAFWDLGNDESIGSVQLYKE